MQSAKSEYTPVVKTARGRRRKPRSSPPSADQQPRAISVQALLNVFVTASTRIKYAKLDLVKPRDWVQQSIVESFRRLKTPSSAGKSVHSGTPGSAGRRLQSSGTRQSLRESSSKKGS